MKKTLENTLVLGHVLGRILNDAILNVILLEAMVHYCPSAHGTWSLYDEG